MRKKRRSLMVAWIGMAAVLACEVLQAQDQHVEFKVFGGMTVKQWFAGDRARQENRNIEGSAVAPLLAGANEFLGRPLLVTRLDKGVEWAISEQEKCYYELPLKMEPAGAAVPPHASEGGEEAEDGKMPEVELRRLPQSRTIAGVESAGYEVVVDGRVMSRQWYAPAKGALAAAMKAQEDFERRRLEAQYAGWPKAEREELVRGGLQTRNLFLGKVDALMPLIKGLPEGIIVKTELLDEETGKLEVNYELVAFGEVRRDASRYEVPAGYKLMTDKEIVRDKLGMDPAVLDAIERNKPADGAPMTEEQMRRLMQELEKAAPAEK